jgi:hypothetical protein
VVVNAAPSLEGPRADHGQDERFSHHFQGRLARQQADPLAGEDANAARGSFGEDAVGLGVQRGTVEIRPDSC